MPLSLNRKPPTFVLMVQLATYASVNKVGSSVTATGNHADILTAVIAASIIVVTAVIVVNLLNKV